MSARHIDYYFSRLTFQEIGPILKISQDVDIACNPLWDDARTRPADCEDAQESQLEAWEDDPVCQKKQFFFHYFLAPSDRYKQDALIRTHKISERLQVDYDIFVSPIYQVPVLYFILRRADKPLGIDGVYEYLVPDQYKRNIQGVGIVGGISSGVRANNLDTRTRDSHIHIS